MIDTSALKPPKHLKADTRKWWESVLAEYLLDEHHVKLLTLAADSWDRCIEARAVLLKDGLTYLDRFKQPKARPEVAIERDCKLTFARLLRELALDVDPPEARPPRTQSRKGR